MDKIPKGDFIFQPLSRPFSRAMLCEFQGVYFKLYWSFEVYIKILRNFDYPKPFTFTSVSWYKKSYPSNWSITDMLSFHQMALHEIDIGTANWILKTFLVYLSHVNTNICKHPHQNIAINTCLSNDGASYTNDVPESKPKEILPQHWWEVIHLHKQKAHESWGESCWIL